MSALRRLIPFAQWPRLSRETLAGDLVAGLTVATVLIPQSMAYAQLAGMPAYHGLYAAFLPVVVGALWGSSRQLSTGPVAMSSLLTGSALGKFAVAGSELFVTLAITLAWMVGAIRVLMGLFRLGAIVSFLSHPVILGFMNAAALIISLSQLNKLLALPLPHSDLFLRDVWQMLAQAHAAHLPTVAMGFGALVVMLALRRCWPRLPAVLITVVLATVVSWATGFERKEEVRAAQFADTSIVNTIYNLQAMSSRTEELHREILHSEEDVRRYLDTPGFVHPRVLALRYRVEVLRLDLAVLERELRVRMAELRRLTFERALDHDGTSRYYLAGTAPTDARTGTRRWRASRVAPDGIVMSGGGDVIGGIPPGLPRLGLPRLDWDRLRMLLSTAFVITLVGFMEAISIAKAMATRTRQRIDPDQELIGQGLANVAAGLTQSFPVSGSLSRSALNLSAGAVSGMSSVVAGLVVLATLLFFTPLLYHLPEAMLAAIILIAVASLLNVAAIRRLWTAHRHDGIAAVVTFAATLAFAPHLETGVLVGAALAIVLYLYRTMRPRVVVLARHPDGTLRDAMLHGLQQDGHVSVVRFDGGLIFANVPYFEDALIDEAARRPSARFLLVVGDGINEIDASGAEALVRVVRRLEAMGVTLVFSGLKTQVLRVMERTGLYPAIGAQSFFRTEDAALDAIGQWARDPAFAAKFILLDPARARTGARSDWRWSLLR